MKKKITAICLCVALVAVAVVGASLAYFTDTDTADNTFTSGKVEITLNEKEPKTVTNEDGTTTTTLVDFTQGKKLVPATVDENNNILNAVDKIVSVTNNVGSEDAYVRLHIAVPKSIDGPVGLWHDEDAANWNWKNAETRVDYTTTIDGVEYNVVCLTYSEKMSANSTTSNVFEWVTLDPSATNADMAAVNGNFNIIVVAEGCQADGFSDAFTALKAAFGTPSATENPWNNYTAPTAGGAE